MVDHSGGRPRIRTLRYLDEPMGGTEMSWSRKTAKRLRLKYYKFNGHFYSTKTGDRIYSAHY